MYWDQILPWYPLWYVHFLRITLFEKGRFSDQSTTQFRIVKSKESWIPCWNVTKNSCHTKTETTRSTDSTKSFINTLLFIADFFPKTAFLIRSLVVKKWNILWHTSSIIKQYLAYVYSTSIDMFLEMIAHQVTIIKLDCWLSVTQVVVCVVDLKT